MPESPAWKAVVLMPEPPAGGVLVAKPEPTTGEALAISPEPPAGGEPSMPAHTSSLEKTLQLTVTSTFVEGVPQVITLHSWELQGFLIFPWWVGYNVGATMNQWDSS